MSFELRFRRIVRGLAILVALVTLAPGCATKGRTGAAIGGGLGAAIGQAVGGNTEATLIGAAVGSGIGYIIGNEADKEEARRQSAVPASQPARTPLSGTIWRVIDFVSKDSKPYESIVVEFKGNGRMITTKTESGGKVTRHDERYRIVGDTLIVNKPGYLINARYRVDGDELIIDAKDVRAVLKRL